MNLYKWLKEMVPVVLLQVIISRTLAFADFLFRWNTLKELQLYTKRIYDDHLKKLMEMEVSIKHVAQTMQDGVGYLSGGRTSDGLPIITLPDTAKFSTLSDDGFLQLMLYLTKVPSFLRTYEESMIEADRGFAIIADRRNESWSSVKTLLYRIAGFFPGSMQCIYIIKPCGWFSRKFSDIGFSFVKDEFKFKTVLLDTVEELHSHIDPSQLTTDFKGTIRFNLQLWIEDRMAIERFAANCHETSRIVQSISDEMNQHELPNDLEAAKRMLHDHTVKCTEMKEDILSTRRHGETLLGCIRKPSKDSASLKLDPDKLSNVCAVESAADLQNKLLVQLEETEKSFERFWEGHKIKLMQCVDYRRFEHDFKQVKLVLDNYLYNINKDNDLGDSVASVESLSKAHSEFEEKTLPAFENAEKLRSYGIELISQENYAGDCIRPKCEEISDLIEDIERKTLTRTIVLSKSLELHQRIQKAQVWCSKGMEVLASQDIDPSQSKENVDKGLKEIDTFLANCKDLKLSNPKEFHTMFSDILNSELSSKKSHREHAEALVTEVVTKMEDVKNMFEKRRESLKKMKLERQQPVVMVAPQAAQIKLPTVNKLSPSMHRRSDSPTNLPVSPSKEKKKVLPRTPRAARKEIEVLRDSATDLPGHENDSLTSKRGHVMNELIETERLYVKELQAVIAGYIEQMNNPSLKHLIPPALVEKTEVLFANWEQLFQFHKNTFLVDLENCQSTPALVGRCFVDREHEINKLYSTYCQNKPQAEALRRECGNDNPFFVECQKQLGHRLPLSAYLLKPVQRITKYQLLLKEMLKYSATETGFSDLQKALDCMLHVLKFVNDSMHQIAITGFEGQLSDLGKLLMQGSFYVWVEHKKGNIKDIRFKKMQRHMFLYEKCILFCKKRDDLKDKICYTFKNKLRVQDLGITEHVKGDRRKFELWLQDKSEIHIIQANNDETKVTWVKEIRELLHSQLEEELAMKDLIEQKTLAIFDNNRINNNLEVTGGETTVLPSPTPSETSSASGNFANMSSADNDEDGWASEEFSDSDDGMDDTGSVSTQAIAMNQYVVLAEYETVEETELPVKEGDVVEVERVGKSGWWLVRKTATSEKGWVPAGYLESLAMRATRSSSVPYLPQESPRISRETVQLRRSRGRSSSRHSLHKRNAIRIESRA
ncbi:guanine nucleotide exchange factor DBS-like isoform X4 [Anneissia japonica]|uniref:guanine nucleotide exchange factor DBS-like isoform X4 n=1 Tax=Anneissia japonica TaxID=1529436 RepID=UPI0014259BD1|nr:guanine nucleotide exchange factor DBS-like isoform X4 [Anneissia japonica]